MPLIALKLEQSLYTQANALVTSGDYTDIQQLLEVALRNQLQLEQRYRAVGDRAAEISEEQLQDLCIDLNYLNILKDYLIKKEYEKYVFYLNPFIFIVIICSQS